MTHRNKFRLLGFLTLLASFSIQNDMMWLKFALMALAMSCYAPDIKRDFIKLKNKIIKP